MCCHFYSQYCYPIAFSFKLRFFTGVDTAGMYLNSVHNDMSLQMKSCEVKTTIFMVTCGTVIISVAPMDYQTLSGACRFPACGTKYCVNVAIVDDMTIESTETLLLWKGLLTPGQQGF